MAHMIGGGGVVPNRADDYERSEGLGCARSETRRIRRTEGGWTKLRWNKKFRNDHYAGAIPGICSGARLTDHNDDNDKAYSYIDF